ncbi:hypothetical protein PTI98_000326 [Pleurotus ostreatus]|nr:hypothetical protein PTI98_000326 [Pleurotus ostreatus]
MASKRFSAETSTKVVLVWRQRMCIIDGIFKTGRCFPPQIHILSIYEPSESFPIPLDPGFTTHIPYIFAPFTFKPIDMSDSARVLALSILQLVSVLGFTILLLTFLLSSRVNRSYTWVGFSVGWIIACLSYDILFFAGQEYDSSPSRVICLVQAALVQSVPVLQATTNLSLIVDIWLLVGDALQPLRISKRQLLTYRVSVVLFPHVFSVSVFVGYILFGIYNPSTVQKYPYSAYCTIVYPGIPSVISMGLFGFFMLFAILFKLLFGWLLYHRWNCISNIRKCVTMIIRIMIFTTANGVVLILNVLLYVGIIDRPTVDITNATFPILIFILMATEQDLLETWIFWRCVVRHPRTITPSSAA